jgi:hypothetical protein
MRLGKKGSGMDLKALRTVLLRKEKLLRVNLRKRKLQSQRRGPRDLLSLRRGNGILKLNLS